jgi:hypothetical protein
VAQNKIVVAQESADSLANTSIVRTVIGFLRARKQTKK